MTKEISDLEYFNIKIRPQHTPTIYDRGDQRDPLPTVVCKCMTGKYPYPEELRNGTFDYPTHLLEVLEEEYNFLDQDPY